jgi:hypothetical protein
VKNFIAGYNTYMKLAGFGNEVMETLKSPMSLMGSNAARDHADRLLSELQRDPARDLTVSDYTQRMGRPPVESPEASAMYAERPNMRLSDTLREQTVPAVAKMIADDKRRLANLGLGALGVGALGAGVLGAGMAYEANKPWYSRFGF